MSFFSLGCGSPPAPSSGDQARLGLLGRLYGEFMANNGGPPANETEFIAFLEKSSDLLKFQGIANPQELLISPRDRQPLKMYYGKEIVHKGPGGFPLVAHESQGVGNTKYVVGARGNVEDMTSEQIEALTTR